MMLRTKTKKILLTTFALLGLSVGMFLNVSPSEAAFGTSPPWVQNDHLLPGTTFAQIIYLSRSDAEDEMKAVVRVTGDEGLVQWIRIENEENLIMTKGQNILPMKVIITVPENASIKNYSSEIYLSLVSTKADSTVGGGEVAIGLGAHISVDISVVGDMISDYQVLSASIKPLIKNEPLSISWDVQNIGNTPINNLDGQIQIFNGTNTELLKSLDFVPFDQPVSPDETKTVQMTFSDFYLTPGTYWVAVKAITGEKTVYENRFLQKVEPVVIKRPSLPTVISAPADTETNKVEEAPEMLPDQELAAEEPVVPVAEVKPAAPASADQLADVAGDRTFLIVGLVGIAFALIEIIGISVILIKARKYRFKRMIK
jgi:hypothetical protein